MYRNSRFIYKIIKKTYRTITQGVSIWNINKIIYKEIYIFTYVQIFRNSNNFNVQLKEIGDT